ncbi:MAG: hypothetical protein Q8L27_01980 [archaeon]|nr:hypothetical protein [archaeon]
MTEQLYSEIKRKVLQNKKQIENALKVKISTKNGSVLIEGEPANEMIAKEMIEAMGLGFSIIQVLDLKNDDFSFQKIPIKSISHRKDLSQVRARIVGTKGRALKNLEFLTGCELVMHDNYMGIIGHNEDVKKAAYALRKLIGGSKHSNVYAYLEEENAKQRAGIW